MIKLKEKVWKGIKFRGEVVNTLHIGDVTAVLTGTEDLEELIKKVITTGKYI